MSENLERFSQPCSAAPGFDFFDRPHLFGRTLLRQRTIASGGSHASVGKPQRKRQKSPQVTDLRFDRHVASAAVSPAVSRVSGAVVSGRTLQCDRFDRGGPKGPHYIEMKSALAFD